MRKAVFLLAILGAAPALTGSLTPSASTSARFAVRLSGAIAPSGTQGRLLVFASTSGRGDTIPFGFLPGDTRLAALEVEHFAPEETILFDPDVQSYPAPFSRFKPGRYRFMALMDSDHSLPYTGLNGGDLHSRVVEAESWDPAQAELITLILDRRIPDRPAPRNTEEIRLVEFTSPALSRFWGRPIVMRAGIVLPPGWSGGSKERFATAYHIHGFGGSYRSAWEEGRAFVEGMKEGKRARMAHVFLDGSFPTGHHEFADSVNNGPWGAALTEEFIPHLEKQFPLAASAGARFLTGHSSGGWSSLWLQVTYPDFFGGAWSTAPDPVDFRRFVSFDATPGSRDNAYRTEDGKARPVARDGGSVLATYEEFARREDVAGPIGGQMASFEWVFSPKGPDGRPMRLFNRITGQQDEEVQKAWRKYDIRHLLEQNWQTLGPKLTGKLHIFCGSRDTFYLEGAVQLLCGFLEQKGSDARCEIVPGRDHSDLYASHSTYPDGLEARIDREMERQFRKTERPAAARAGYAHTGARRGSERLEPAAAAR